MSTCKNCRSTFDTDVSTAQDPERFCRSECETAHVGKAE